MFDKPQWLIRGAEVEEPYGYLRNRVRIVPKTGRERSALIVIPTELFILLERVMPEAQANGDANLYLEQVGNGWVLGVESGGLMQDLWRYRNSGTPPWL